MDPIIVKCPSKCTKKELEAFCEKVIEGGQVTPMGLEARMRNAELLALYFDKDSLVGIAALKRPYAVYRKKVFKKAGVLKDQNKYPLEVGWVYTKPSYQKKGIASGLVLELLKKYSSENMFATTKTSNIGMQRILKKNGFQESGKPYRAESNEYFLQLFVRDIDC